MEQSCVTPSNKLMLANLFSLLHAFCNGLHSVCCHYSFYHLCQLQVSILASVLFAYMLTVLHCTVNTWPTCAWAGSLPSQGWVCFWFLVGLCWYLMYVNHRFHVEYERVCLYVHVCCLYVHLCSAGGWLYPPGSSGGLASSDVPCVS